MNEPATIEVDRLKLLSGGRGIGCLLMSAFLTWGAYSEGVVWYFAPLIVFLFLLGLGDLRECVFGRVRLRIGPAGIWHWAFGTIFWDDVESTGIFDTLNLEGIGFRLRQGHRSMRNAHFLGRLNARFRYLGYDAIVTCRELQISLEELQKEVGRYVKVGFTLD